MNSDLYTVHGSHKLYFLSTFSLKMGPTALFTHLKIILLQCFQFQFSVSAKISSIQSDPMYTWPTMICPVFKRTKIPPFLHYITLSTHSWNPNVRNPSLPQRQLQLVSPNRRPQRVKVSFPSPASTRWNSAWVWVYWGCCVTERDKGRCLCLKIIENRFSGPLVLIVENSIRHWGTTCGVWVALIN